MLYKDEEHMERLLTLINKRSGDIVDSEYAASYYLLTSNTSVWYKIKV